MKSLISYAMILLVKRNLKLEHQMQMAREMLREQADVLSNP